MEIKRDLEDLIKKRIDYQKAIIVLGPRQVGKTTLIKKIATELDANFMAINGDDPANQLLWGAPSESFIMNQIGSKKVIFIDEAQRLANIGIASKIILDSKKNIQLLITGSSALDLASEIKEPLTGRKWEYMLYPLSWNELRNHYSFDKTIKELKHRLVMGSYPEAVNHPESDKMILNQLAGSYLYKDILEKGNIKKPDILLKILKALAFQVGSEVSFTEIANLVQVDKNTVISYIDLLEKAFVVFKLDPLSRNLRNEISSSRKIFFYDNGIRNAIINQFAPYELRNDIGPLWENYLIAERMKLLQYHEYYGSRYFWRSRDAELDYIEEIDGKFYAYEFKWNPKAKAKISDTFIAAYKPIKTEVIHQDNFWEWLQHYPY